MSHIASGTVLITGKKESIIRFTNRFVFQNDEKKTLPNHRYFAKSSIPGKREKTYGEIIMCFNAEAEGSEFGIAFDAEFDRSACRCLVDGYPQQFPDECVTLVEACKEDGVSVEIRTGEESGVYEEHIRCDSGGNISATRYPMPVYICAHCGEKTTIPTFIEDDYVDCENCGECEWKEFNDEV